MPYCKKYDIGIILVKDFLDKSYNSFKLYRDNPGFQRLLAPEEIRKNFPKYTYICDIDLDCIPGYQSRNIFHYVKNIKKNDIFLVQPIPKGFSRSELGKKISLLRSLYVDKNFPLDSLCAASDLDEAKIFKNTYMGKIATIGTCIGHTETLAKTGLQIYQEIVKKNNFSYLQSYRIEYYSKYLNIKWLPYEFQAIWNFEMSINYPFCFQKNFEKIIYEALMATLYKVDFLHFAGSWPENAVFNNLFYEKKGKLKEYYNFILKYLKMKLKIRSYEKIKPNNNN